MNRERLRPFLTGAAIVIAIGGLYAVDRGRMFCGQLRGPRIGQVVPDFAAADLSGQRVKLSSLRGKVVLLDFWATWCRACVRKMPQIERLQAELGPRGLTVLAINIEGNREVVEGFLRKRPTKLTVLLDDGRLADQYAAFSLPHLAIIDRQGKLAYSGAGAGLREKVRALLDHETPAR